MKKPEQDTCQPQERITASPAWRSIPALAERLNAGARHETFSAHALRHLVRNGERNGLAPHVRRIGRKVLVDEVGFLAWLTNFQVN